MTNLQNPSHVFSQSSLNSPIFLNNMLIKVSFLQNLSNDPIKKFKITQK